MTTLALVLVAVISALVGVGFALWCFCTGREATPRRLLLVAVLMVPCGWQIGLAIR